MFLCAKMTQHTGNDNHTTTSSTIFNYNNSLPYSLTHEMSMCDVCNCYNYYYFSGGQKRRVSLAAALVHSPPLLILDEPTVGVDPLLRKAIWRHLVTLTQTERISVIITTHYIEEARQANVVGLMRNGRLLAENSPENLMLDYGQTNLEDVFLHLCVTDSARRSSARKQSSKRTPTRIQIVQQNFSGPHPVSTALNTSRKMKPITKIEIQAPPPSSSSEKVELSSYVNETLDFTSGDDDIGEDIIDEHEQSQLNSLRLGPDRHHERVTVRKQPLSLSGVDAEIDVPQNAGHDSQQVRNGHTSIDYNCNTGDTCDQTREYLAQQALGWLARRNNELNMIHFHLNNRAFVDGTLQPAPLSGGTGSSSSRKTHHHQNQRKPEPSAHQHNGLNTLTKNAHRYIKSSSSYHHRYKRANHWSDWWRTLVAVTWKNYIRLRRNPPVLIFQFMLPAIQVILFCLCIGGEPFDVPVAIVNEESIPRASLQFLNGLDRRVIRQVKYDNLSSAIDAVKQGHVWGALHIPDKYSQNLQSRLIMGEEVNNETLTNGTIRVYPDLTSKSL